MFNKTIIVCLFGFVLVECVDHFIEFNISGNQIYGQLSTISCDHSNDNLKTHFYTAMEAEPLTIKRTYVDNKRNRFLSHLNCVNNNNKNERLLMHGLGTETKFLVTKKMGTVWKCSIYIHKNSKYFKNMVYYMDGKYATADCFMQIHVRPKVFTHRILINYMEMSPNRTDSSEKHVDFNVIYNYADGDNVTVTCSSLFAIQINMQYDYADRLSNAFNTSTLTSESRLNFRAKLDYKHNNTDIICTFKDAYDYTKVRIKFLTQATFPNFVKIVINEMNLRPKHTYNKSTHHFFSAINIMLSNDEPVHLLCETQGERGLELFDYEVDRTSIYKNTTDTGVRAERYLTLTKNISTLKCATNGPIEISEINFILPETANKICQLKMDVSPNNMVMEFTDGSNKILYNELEDDSVAVAIKCYTYCASDVKIVPVTNVQLNITDNQESDVRTLSQQSTVHSQLTKAPKNGAIVCSMIEQLPTGYGNTLGRITMIFNKKVVTTTTSTTTTTTTTTTTMTTKTDQVLTSPFNHTTSTYTHLLQSPNLSDTDDDDPFSKWLLGLICGITCIVLICVSTIMYKLWKKNQVQSNSDPNYENLQSPSEASIPPYPPQFNSEYAVPTDQRQDDDTYSVPHKPKPDIYSVPIPKNQRKTNKKVIQPIYNNEQRNGFKDSGDPNYSEVVFNNQNVEENYTKVVPKSKRRQQDNNAYENLNNANPYANTGSDEPEPMYCDPNTMAASERNPYINVSNNALYTNRPGAEYAEPAYCELSKHK